MESFQRIEEKKKKHDLMELHFLARDIGQFTALTVCGNKDMKIMELWDYFPELFSEEKAESEEEMQRQQAAVYKAQMIDFAYRHNHARTGGES